MIELSHVTKTFGGAKRALDELSLTVPQGETVVRDTAYQWYTNTALTVSGTLDFSVAGPYVLCAVKADNTYDAAGKKPTMYLAPDPSDEGVLNITNGTSLGRRWA